MPALIPDSERCQDRGCRYRAKYDVAGKRYCGIHRNWHVANNAEYARRTAQREKNEHGVNVATLLGDRLGLRLGYYHGSVTLDVGSAEALLRRPDLPRLG